MNLVTRKWLAGRVLTLCVACLGTHWAYSVPVAPTATEISTIVQKLDAEMTATEAGTLHDKIEAGWRIRDYTGDDVKGFMDDPNTMPISAMTNGNWHFNGWFPRNIHRYYQHYRATGDPYCIQQLEYYAQWVDEYVIDWPEEQEEIFNLFAHPMVALLLLERMDARIDPVDTATLDKCRDYLTTFLAMANTHTGIDPAERDSAYLTPLVRDSAELAAREQEIANLGLSNAFWHKPWNQRATTVTMLAMTIKATRIYHRLTGTQLFQSDEDKLLGALNFWIERFYNHSSTYTYNGTEYVVWAYSDDRITATNSVGSAEYIANGANDFKLPEDTDHASHNIRALIYLWELGFGGSYFTDDYIEAAANTAVDLTYLAHINLNSYCPEKLTNSAPHLLSPQTAPYYSNSWLTADGFGVRAIWWVPISGFRPDYYVLFTEGYRNNVYDDQDSSFAFCRYTRKKRTNDQLIFISDNYKPVASNAVAVVNEDSSTAITLSGADADGDSLTYSVVLQPTHGTLAGMAPDLTYTPNENYNGSDHFTFNVNDGTTNSLDATVSITINAVQSAPVFSLDPIIGNHATQDVAYVGSIVATDANGDSLSYSLTSIPTWLTVSTNGVLGGTPANSDVGLNSFTVQADDGNGGTDVATLQIVVRATTTQTVVDYLEFDASATNFWSAPGTGSQALRPIGHPGSNRVWNVDETLIIEFDVQGVASTDPIDYSSSSMSLGFGLGDNAEAICWGIKHQADNYQFANSSIDTSAGSAGSMSANLYSSGDRVRYTGIEGTAYDLYDNNETAHMILSATYKGGTEYDLSWTVQNTAVPANSFTMAVTRDEGVKIDFIDEFLIRRNLTSGTADYTFSDVVIKVESETMVVVADTDGDGLTDAQELALGTDPYDPGSGFGIDGLPLPTAGKITLTWPSATGVLFRIWESPDLADWTVVRDWATGLTPPEDALEFDLTPSNGFFKVEVKF